MVTDRKKEKPIAWYDSLVIPCDRKIALQGANGCGGCTGERTLTDRRGESFPVLCEARRFSVLSNPIPLYTGDMAMPPADFVTLCFTAETAEQCAETVRLFAAGKPLPGKRTAGLYDKVLL